MGAANFEGINAEVNVALLPFLFTSLDNARNAWGGDFGAQFAEKLIEPMGFKVLSIWESGYRHMTNNTRPLEKPEDLKGIKFRTNENSMKVAMYDALDASIVIMAFSDVYTGLQNGTIDGQENPLFTIYNSRFYEVQKYLSLTEHFYPVCPLMMSEITWNKLSPEQQDIVADAMKKSVDYERELAGEELDKMLEGCKEKGMEVNEVDKAPFIEAVQPVYEKYNSQFGSLIEKINAAK